MLDDLKKGDSYATRVLSELLKKGSDGDTVE